LVNVRGRGIFTDIQDRPATGKWKMTKVTSDNTIRLCFNSTKRRLPTAERCPFTAMNAMKKSGSENPLG